MAFTIYLIHHSHTDIGYTDYQEKIEQNHIYYIRHAIRILDHAHTDRPEWLGYVWQCECWWAVEKFLESAAAQEKESFWHYVKSGEIGLSASYANLTELIDEPVLGRYLKRAGEQSSVQGVPVRSAMTADINGYSWGCADSLANAGVQNLLSFVHTHHGRYPLFQKQTPFWWEAPSGEKVLVWLGDHYQVGNELGVSKLWSMAYTCCDDGLGDIRANDTKKAEKRIQNYVRTMQSQGYRYDFTVLGVSGYFTDNACPSPLTIEFVKEYNERHSDEIRLQMVTLDEFFERLRAEEEKCPFPVYQGDWTDWWADGVGSTPVLVQHFREAQRRLALAEALNGNEICDRKLLKEAQDNLMLYAEHTWGHSASVSEPYDPSVNRLELRKGLYAQRAHEAASRALLQIEEKNGATPTLFGQGEQEFVIMNPCQEKIKTTAAFELEEAPESTAAVWDIDRQTSVPCQSELFSRGVRLNVQVELEAGEKKRLRMVQSKPPVRPSAGMRAACGAERVCDMPSENKDGICHTPWKIENTWVRMDIDSEKGIAEIYDKNKKHSLIRKEAPYPPFTPVYECTPAEMDSQCRVRREMGRNRKGTAVKRSAGKIKDIRILESGEIFDKAELSYQLEGTKVCLVILTVYRNLPRIDAELRLHKDSVWSPENLYLTLPFAEGEEDTCYLEKTGCVLRPRIDQLPGSCIDFYLIQNGVWYTQKTGTVLVALPDTPLVTFGDLKPHPILLAGENKKNNDMLYSWVMNNFWETNFKVDLGGFHQYHYSILSLEETNAENVRRIARQQNMGTLAFQRTCL